MTTVDNASTPSDADGGAPSAVGRTTVAKALLYFAVAIVLLACELFFMVSVFSGTHGDFVYVVLFFALYWTWRTLFFRRMTPA